ncbi:MAG: HEAT repeat domain-containing protein, partial [Polyangiaceae bacterium]
MTDRAVPLGLSSRDQDRMAEVQRLTQLGVGGIHELIALLGDPSWVVRRAVVASLARLGEPAIAQLCIVLQTDRTSEARVAATVDALVASGGEVETAVLAMGASANDAAVVCDAAQILGRRKSRVAVPALSEWVGHTDDNVAVAAIEALGRIGGTAAVEPLLAALRTKNFFRTFPAIAVLGQSADPRVVEPLVGLLDDPHYAGEAASALGRSGHIHAVAPLTRLLPHAHHGLARTAARALTELRTRNLERTGDAEAVLSAVRDAASDLDDRGAIKRALQGADSTDTIAIATVLSWMHDETGVAALLGLLDADAKTAEAAIDALRNIGQENDALLRGAIRNGDSARRARLLPLLGARRSVVGDLVICLKDPDPAVRTQACDALARIGDPSIVAELFTVIGDLDARVSQAAIGAVQSLGSNDAKSHALIAARSPDLRTRRAALRILSYFGYPEGLDVLLEAIVDSDERIRDAA